MGTSTPRLDVQSADAGSAQNVFKHQQLAHPADPDPPSGLLDNISDTLLNAFTKVRKPDERFVEMKTHLDQFDEGLTSIERLGGRSKLRLGDLSGDYEDLAASVQGLGYLESGITEPLLRFEHALVEFGHAVRDSTTTTAESFLEHLHSLLAYSTSFRAVLKLRDQKQLDFEELSSYLSNVSSERDRLAGGYGYGMGIGNYFKDKVESLRGGETESGKEAKMARLDAKIKEVSTTTCPWDRTDGRAAPRCGHRLARHVQGVQRRAVGRVHGIQGRQAGRNEGAAGRVRGRADRDVRAPAGGVGEVSLASYDPR